MSMSSSLAMVYRGLLGRNFTDVSTMRPHYKLAVVGHCGATIVLK